MDFQKDYQFQFHAMPENSFLIEYFLIPLIFILLIFLTYSYVKKKLLKEDKEDLESLKLLKELLDTGVINENDFKKKKNRITSKW